jgi:glycerol-3-phosphate acyltransferase PlsY
MDRWWLWTILAYFCGATPFGLLIGLIQGIDLRKVGSGNLGATNAIRALGKGWGGLCLLLDITKGLAPVLAGGLVLGYIGQEDLTKTQVAQWLSVGAAAVVGHVFPIWLRFKGGKGVATGLGALLGFWPLMTLSAFGAFLIWIIVVVVSRYVSLASMVAAVSLPVLTLLAAVLIHLPMLDAGPFILLTSLLAVLVLIRHRQNIARLKAGTEHRISSGSRSGQNNEQDQAPPDSVADQIPDPKGES